MMKEKNILFALFMSLILSASVAVSGLQAQGSDYVKLYNDKVALELELRHLKNQYQNEKDNFNDKIKEQSNTIDALNKKIALLTSQIEENIRLSDARIKELNDQIAILKKSGSDKVKKLIDENTALQKRFDSEMKKLMQDLNDEKSKCIAEAENLKNSYEKKIAGLEKDIANLNDEIAALKKLSDQQKNELSRMESQSKELEKQLSEEIKSGQIRLKKLRGRLIINIDDKISFDSGSAQLKPDIMAALKKITKILNSYPENNIVIEGHTDNIPIRTVRFRDNWHLSTERALSVLNYILKESGVNPVRFSAGGYGEFSPIVPNDTPENRALNRRVDIVVIPRVEALK